MQFHLPALVSIAALLLSGAPRGHAQAIDPATGNAQPFAGTPVSNYKIAWSDEFGASSLDEGKWNYRTDSRYWSLQRAANVRLAGGLLHLDLKKETFGTTSYTGGGVISKALFRYGYYEARMKVPPGSGWHTSFWMMKYNRPATDTVAIELDVIENDSVTPLKYGVNTHRHLPTPHLTYGSKSVTTPSLNADFHVFGCEFTPSLIRYFCDGALVQTVDATQFPHNDLNVWLTSIAAPLGGTTSVDDTKLPASAQFDYVRYFAPRATASVNITSPGGAGVTLASVEQSLKLTATATSSDPLLSPDIVWSKSSGPGDAVFSDPASLSTSVRFSAAGSYVLQCTATVDGNSTTARVPVAVNAPLTALYRESFDGYNHVATFIRGDSVAWNSGERDQMIIGRWNSQPLRLILSYDLTGIPADAVIEGATLELWTESGGGTGTVGDLQLHGLLGTPVEGSGTGSSATDGAGTGTTWASRTGATTSGNLWSSPGADFEGTVLSTCPGYDATLKLHPLVFPGTTAFTSLVESARATATPLNLLVRSPTTEAGSSNFISRLVSDDAADVDHRPQLTISYRGNHAPDPRPGPPGTFVAGSSVSLTGAADRADSVEWSQLSGPAPALFQDARIAAASVVFPVPGVYGLRLTARNALAETSALRTVTVVAPPTAYEQWSTRMFGAAAIAGTSGLLDDPDHDGQVNLLEFATAASPTASGGAPASLTELSGALEFSYRRSHEAVADGLQYRVEWSDTLGGDWSDGGVVQAEIPGSDDGVATRWKATVPKGALRRFVRLRVTQANP